MKQLFRPLERRLTVTVAVAVLPLAVLALVNLFSMIESSRERLFRATVETMRSVMVSVEGELNATISALETLALHPRIAEADLEGARRDIERVLGARDTWANVILVERSGRQLINMASTALGPAPEPASIEEVFRTGRPIVGNLSYGPAMNEHAFAVRVPVMKDGQVAYALSAIIPARTMLELLNNQRLPAEDVVAILDRNDVVVARSRRHDERVGKPTSAYLREVMRPGELEGWGRSETLDGDHVYAVYSRSPRFGWTAAVGISRAALDVPVRQAFLALLAGVVLSLLAGLAAAYFAARGITRPMHELQGAAMQLGKGVKPLVPATDIPEVREAARALESAHAERETLLERERRLRREAEAESRSKDEFLAMLGHELRNPLAGVTNAVQVIERTTTLGGVPAEALRVLRRQAQHLVRLTDDLLDAGRVVNGKVRVDRAPVDLGKLVQSAVSMMRGTGALERHNVMVGAEAVWVSGDTMRLEQVVSNLVSNAVKYTPAGGTVTVTVSRHGAHACLRVKDTGIGLDPQLVPRMFDLFVQGERGLDRAQGGLGIGLTLVRGLAQLHGGTVEARSEGAGRGTEITVRLPAIDAPPAARASSDGPAPERRARKIALIDDNEDGRQSLRLLLSVEGDTHIVEAADGPGAVELVLREKPDVAIVDIGLPGFDGLEVARRIRARLGRAVRLVALTGYGSESHQSEAAAAGFDAFVVKPATLRGLQVALRGG